MVVEDSGSWRVLLGFRSSLSQVPGYAVLLIDTCLAGTSPHDPWIEEVLYEVLPFVSLQGEYRDLSCL